MKLSIILPAYNEDGNIEKMVSGLLERYDNDILEIIVVNDASTDTTAEKVLGLSDPKIKLINRSPPSGVGRALKDGINAINKNADWVLMMDSDFISNLDEVQRLISKAREGKYDGVYGSRYMNGGVLEGYPHLKRISNRIYHCALKSLLGIQLHDVTNNFKLMKSKVMRRKLHSKNFAINAEIGITPIIEGYKIAEVPVSWIQRISGKSTFKVLKLIPSYGVVLVRCIVLKTSILINEIIRQKCRFVYSCNYYEVDICKVCNGDYCGVWRGKYG